MKHLPTILSNNTRLLRAIYLLLFWGLLVMTPGYVNANDNHVKALQYDGRGGRLLSANQVELLEDKQKQLTLQDVLAPANAKRFVTVGDQLQIQNKNIKSAYWLRFTIHNTLPSTENIVIDFLNFNIDQLDFYKPDPNKGFIKYEVGDKRPFMNREINNATNTFLTILNPNQSQTYYVRIESSFLEYIPIEVLEANYFIGQNNNFYISSGIFLGLVLALGLYNLIMFFSVRDNSYLYYILYVISFLLNSMCASGLDTQFIWFNWYWINDHAGILALILVNISTLLYTTSFLSTAKNAPKLHRVMIWVIVFNIILIILKSVGVHVPVRYSLLHIVPVAMALVSGLIIYLRGYKPAGFFVIGLCFLFTSVLLQYIRLYYTLDNSFVINNAFNLGSVIEMLFLSIALSARVNRIVKEKTKVEHHNLLLHEKKQFADQMNLMLEEKVAQRTEEILRQKDIIEEKNIELDTFFYRASHDLRGPLRSVIGITNLGLLEVKDEAAIKYFEMIGQSTNRLDTILSDMIHIMKARQADLLMKKTDVGAVINDITTGLQHNPLYKQVHITVDVNQQFDFYSDENLLYSIFQNIIENAIKYHNPSQVKPSLHITADIGADGATFSFADNGLGISEEYQSRVFDIFFKGDSKNGTGLGLYIVKISVQKLGGTITLVSKYGEGSTFIVRFPATSVPIAENREPANKENKYKLQDQ